MSINNRVLERFFAATRALVSALTFIFVLAGLTHCTRHSDSGGQVVNLATWGNYITSDQIKKFEAESKTKVNISYYNSNEELLAKVQAGASGIDVAIPSDYMVRILIKLNLLHEIDHGKISNFDNILPELTHQDFDPDNRYSAPYTWSTAGLAVNRELYKGEIKGWKNVFTDQELAGKISMLDDAREALGAALKFHGYSVNSVDKNQLEKAEKTLQQVKSKIKMFRSDTIDVLLKKEVAVAHAYSTDALQAVAKSGGKIEYILPTEGGTRAIDNVVILKSSKNLQAAHRLVNFMLSPEVNVNFVKTMWGGPILKTTRAQLPESMRNNPVLFPSPAALGRFEPILDLGANTKMYDEIWTRIKNN